MLPHLAACNAHDDFEQQARFFLDQIDGLLQATVLPGLRLGARGSLATVVTTTRMGYGGRILFGPIVRSVYAATMELKKRKKTTYAKLALQIL